MTLTWLVVGVGTGRKQPSRNCPNVLNQWDGVPEDVLKQYGLAYEEKEMNAGK